MIKNIYTKLIQFASQKGFDNKPICGEFILGDNIGLFPSGVYGLFAKLEDNQKRILFDEAIKRNINNISRIEDFKPFTDNIFPLYWGLDKSIGKRPYEHLANPEGTGVIRLSTLESISNIQLYYTVLVVDKASRLERILQIKYQHLLLTTNRKYEKIP